MKNIKKIIMLSVAVLASTQIAVCAYESDKVTGEGAYLSSTKISKTLPKVSVTLASLPVKNYGQPFKDISHSIYKNYINSIYHLGITTGYTPTRYNPEANVTRGEMAVFLYRLAGSPRYTPPFNVFTDITQYKTQILWLSATTVTRGTGSTYNPNGNVTRGQMAAFLHRMAVASGKASPSKKYNAHFSDAKKHMFANDIGWLRAQEITTGYTPTSFKPDASITRGEMAAFIHRFYNKLNVQNQHIADKTSIIVRNTVIYTGEPWKAEDNFVSATDKNGNSISFKQVNVKGGVNTKKAGTYTIAYSYNGKIVEAKVEVKNNQSGITLTNRNLTKNVGDIYSEAQLRDNIATLTDKTGQDVLSRDKNKVTIIAKDSRNIEVPLSDLTKKADTYTLIYNYEGRTVTATLRVKTSPVQSTIHDIFITKNNSNLEMFKTYILNRLLYKDQKINVRHFNMKKSEVTCEYYGNTLVGEPALRYIVRGNALHSTLSTIGSPQVTYDGEYIDSIEYSYSPLWTEEFIEKIIMGYDEAMKAIKEDDTDFAKIAKLHDWIVKNVSYGMSKGHADFAAGALADRSAVCGGYANAYSFLLEQVGIENRYVAANTVSGAHAWNLVQLEGHWFHVDCTWDRGLGINPTVNRTYFLLNDNEFNQDGKHTEDWKTSGKYPKNEDYIIENKFYKDYKDILTDDEIRNNPIRIIYSSISSMRSIK